MSFYVIIYIEGEVMKKMVTCFLILFLIFGGVGGYFLYKNIKEEKRIEEIKKGWYVEIIYKEPINVRESASSSSKAIGQVKNGEIYKVLDINVNNSTYYWYKIEYKDTEGWIASGRKIHWVNDVNNPTDIATPVIKFEDNVYKVVSINDINYKHLTVVEDTDIYEITHVIYHEVKPSQYIDQYWILYTITDGAGKSSSKMQKIEFEEKPDESQVLDFSKYKKS